MNNTIPREIEPILRPYQKKGFRWLYALKENHLGGLLADEMGTLSNIQIISLLAAWKDRKRVLNCMSILPCIQLGQ